MVTTVRKSLIEPLSSKVPIVDAKGNPTAYFQRLLQRIQAGSSISVSPDGIIDVAEGEITLEMLQEIQFKTVLGLNDVVNGPVEEVTASQILDWLGTAAQGDILYRGASSWALLHAGTSGQFLKTLGAGANPLWAAAGPATGTSFPGSPDTGDHFQRSDQNYTEYFWNGTRWLSTQLFIAEFQTTESLMPFTANGVSLRSPNPWTSNAAIYVERCTLNSFVSTTTAANYFTAAFIAIDSSTNTTLGTISQQNITQNVWVGQTLAIGVLIASTYDEFQINITESGTANSWFHGSIHYRIVG